jgi:ABA4-like protein
MSADALFLAGQLFAAALWLPMIFAPHWRVTERVIASPWPLAALCALFAVLLADALRQVDLAAVFASGVSGSASAVHETLSLRALAAPAWTHYTVVDLFLGRWLFLREGARDWKLSALLVLVFAAAPLGLLVVLLRGLGSPASESASPTNRTETRP